MILLPHLRSQRVKPVAVVIVSEDGVKLQSLSDGSTFSIIEKVVDTVGKTVASRSEKTKE